jgi:thiamine biosynthesis protein ThiI
MPTDYFRPNCIVVHYHEIALKGDNRPQFIERLAQNVLRATRDLGAARTTSPRGRILLHLPDGADWDRLRERLLGIFGIANFSPAMTVPTEYTALEQAVLGIVSGRELGRFRIAARRADKRSALTSMDLNQRLGRAVQERTGASVDLDRPNTTIHIEVLGQDALVYLEKVVGPGGLPVGVSGRVATLISGGIDSPVAAYRMMKRGCSVVFVHFHGHPFLTRASAEKAGELVQLLTRHQFESKLHLIAFGEVQRQVVLAAPAALRVVLYRRLMLRIAEQIARAEGAQALVTGESLGQVASQTLENLCVIEQAATLPILRPLIGYDKEEITREAKAVGSYPISIEPDQDCCRLFIPPHPAVRARLLDVQRTEERLALDDLVQLALKQAETSEYRFP